MTFESWNLLKEEIDSFSPDFVLGLGVAVGRPKVSIEKIGLNYMHANVPDNLGKIYSLEKIDLNKPLAYETKFDVQTLLEHLNKNEVPSEISFNADFIHVPANSKLIIDMNIKAPSLPTELIAKALYRYFSKK